MSVETQTERTRRLRRENMRRYRKEDPEQAKRRAADYYLKNKERLKPIRKAWMAKNKAKWAEYQRQWQQDHPGRCKAYTRAWAMRNPGRAKEVWASWDERHPERRKQIGKLYRTRHPEVAVRTNTIRRLRVGDFERYQPLIDSLVREVSRLPFVVCTYCRKRIEGKFHFDHIVPISRGGKHVRENLCVACVRCNLSKGPKLLTEWKNGIYANR